MTPRRRIYTVEELLRDELPLGRSKFYEEVRAGRIEVVKIGRRTYIPAEAIEDYVALLRREAGPDAAAQAGRGGLR